MKNVCEGEDHFCNFSVVQPFVSKITGTNKKELLLVTRSHKPTWDITYTMTDLPVSMDTLSTSWPFFGPCFRFHMGPNGWVLLSPKLTSNSGRLMVDWGKSYSLFGWSQSWWKSGLDREDLKWNLLNLLKKDSWQLWASPEAPTVGFKHSVSFASGNILR